MPYYQFGLNVSKLPALFDVVFFVSQLSSLEIEWATRGQNLDESISLSLCAIAL